MKFANSCKPLHGRGNMGDRDNNNLIPIVAGVVVGAGILTLLYKMFFSGGKKPAKHNMRLNQQIGARHKCTCEKGGTEPCQIHPSKKKNK